MAQSSAQHEPRRPDGMVLYGVVRDHFETFRAETAGLRGGEGLPRLVEQEFRETSSGAAGWPVDRARRVSLLPRQDVGVHRKRRFDLLVTEAFLHDTRRHASSEQRSNPARTAAQPV